ncbi:unnamed protein product [Owenia fusiformis]|uniref:Uncharacterized protein n=1 Tax=Owenia fusiformis TaxID=6347 RepID=A0A8J1UA62_OWEFU|nr:unnamed protein product [Owenia fusiformis]
MAIQISNISKIFASPGIYLTTIICWQIIFFLKFDGKTGCLKTSKRHHREIFHTNRIDKRKSNIVIEQGHLPRLLEETEQGTPRKTLVLGNHKPHQAPKLLTIFTTFSEHDKSMFGIQNNTICNFAHFPGKITNLVVFVTESFHQNRPIKCSHTCLNDTICDTVHPKWSIIHLNKTLMPNGKRPILKSMFLEVQRQFSSEFYMYTNNDILFHTDRLLNSLKTISVHTKTEKMKNYLITGGRRNEKFYDPTKQATKILKSGKDDEIMQISRTAQKMNGNDKEYLITGRDSFPWKSIPNFVIGAPFYADWLILYCNKLYTATFDVSYTTMAIHQEGQELADKHTQMTTSLDNINADIFKRFVKHEYNIKQSNLKCCTYRTLFKKDFRFYVQKNPLFISKNCILKDMQLPNPG